MTKLRTHVVRGQVVLVAPGPVREHPRGRAWERTRQRVAERDRWRCHRCGEPIDPRLKKPDPMALAIDHIVPLSQGGRDDETNLAAMHAGCNQELERTRPT